MRAALIVGLGGFAGSICRYKVSGMLSRLAGEPLFPIGTLSVNVLGCLAIGILAGAAEKFHVISPEFRLFLITGFLGGFTTFSAFGFETIYLLKRHEPLLALGNVAASVIVCLGGVYLGLRAVEALS